MAPGAVDKKALVSSLASVIALLGQFSSSLSSSAARTSDVEPLENPPNPLHVLRDTGKLLKSHATKLSLLAINEPFTPSAVSKVLKEMSGTCLPAMMSAVQICCDQRSTSWGMLMTKEVETRVARAFRELEALLKEIRSIAEGTATNLRQDTLSATGVLWEACDALVELDNLGIAGLSVKKAEQYRDTIKDAINELQEWRDGEDTDTEGHEDELLDDFDEGVDGDTDSIEDIFNAANSMPKDDPELKKLVDEAEGKLKKIVLLYTALVKRRLKTFKVDGNDAETNIISLDETMESLKTLPNLVDELIGAFYDLDNDTAVHMLDALLEEAVNAANRLHSNWQGQNDEFTDWHQKWEKAVG